MKELLKELTQTNAIASNEEQIVELILSEVKDFNLEIIRDNIGSLILKKKGKEGSIKVAYYAHMDEVGFMVKNKTPEGMLNVIPIGAVRENARTNQLVNVTTSKGKIFKGMLQPNTSTDDLYVDLGADDLESISEISVGDMVTYDSKFYMINENRYMGKALDDRCGVAALIELIKLNMQTPNEIYYVFSSSEEVGLRGAQTSTYLIEPDYAFIVDVACSKSEFDRSYKNNRQLGKGPMILHYDKGMIPNYKFLNKVKSLADSSNIKYQEDMFSGGSTDASSVHLSKSGVKSLVIAIPNRYGHGPYAIGDLKDLNNTIKLLKILGEYEWEK